MDVDEWDYFIDGQVRFSVWFSLVVWDFYFFSKLNMNKYEQIMKVGWYG